MGKGSLDISLDPQSLSFHRWKAENSMVMAWLVNSIKPDIGQTYLFLSTRKRDVGCC